MSHIAGKLLSAAAMATLLLPQIPAPKQQSTKPPAASNQASQMSNTAEALRLNNLGSAYMGQQRFEQALKLFERAAALDPKLLTARLNVGIANSYLQRFEPAREAFQQVIAREPQNARARRVAQRRAEGVLADGGRVVGGLRDAAVVLARGQAVVGVLLSGAPRARCAAPCWAWGIVLGG